MRVVDTVATVINAQNGVEVGTEIIWEYVNRFGKPSLFVVNQIDHPKANFEAAYSSIVAMVGKNAVKIQYPFIVGSDICIIDVLKMKMYKFGKDGGKPEKLPIPDSQKAVADELHNELVERAAENDEELMELFFEKGTLSEDEMRQGIKKGMLNHELFPVFCVSALKDMGTGRLMGFIDNVAPGAADLKPEQSLEGKDVVCLSTEPTALFVFKSFHEPSIGKITFFKVKSGEVKVNDKLENSRTGDIENINQLFIMDGKKRESVEKLSAGDIGATIKLKDTETNDTLHAVGKKITIRPITFPEDRIQKVIEPARKKMKKNWVRS